LRDYPPTDVDEWKAFARTLPTTEVADLAEGRTPQGPILSYRFPANQQRHYDEMTRFPEGYLIAGDAVCSFNPIYGQGMSVAFSEARALDDTLRKGDTALARAFFARVKDLAAGPWAIATGEDYRFPQVEGKRPPGFALISRYMERAHRAAAKDEVVLRRFFEVASLLAPPTAMMAKEIAWRVALGGRGARPPTHTRKVQI
jgi:2-polyprenyl-6-methoxyphenol hydroxylase-like FAD-dependent oxidoreductase